MVSEDVSEETEESVVLLSLVASKLWTLTPISSSAREDVPQEESEDAVEELQPVTRFSETLSLTRRWLAITSQIEELK
jgi:hypothetical protein